MLRKCWLLGGTKMLQIGDTLSHLMRGGDKRTFSLPLADPWIPFYTFFVYVLLVKVIGPKFMENRKPFELKNILLIYNGFQVLLSAYLFILFSQHGWMSLSNWFKCKPIEVETTPEFLHLLSGHHLYYISKYTELLDTVFFVARKKHSQVTFLHVYHHGSMPLFTCLTLRWSPGGSMSAIGFLNTGVHVAMYGYYLLAALGPQVQPYLWWKRYLTTLQLIQFLALIGHFIIVMASSCNFPRPMSSFIVFNTAFNFILFYHFYTREYKQQHKGKKTETTTSKTKLEVNGNSIVNGEKSFINGQNGSAKLNGFHSTLTQDSIRHRAHS